MSSNLTIASLSVSAIALSLLATALLPASLIAAEAPASSVAAAPAAVKTDSSLTVKNAPASTAPGGKSCEVLKSEIDGKLKAKGVKAFTLDIVPAADVKSEKIVGSCEAGAKKIAYKRG